MAEVTIAELLARARVERWPTSSIDAMANHHLCGHLARDYVNECFAGHAATREDGQGGARQDAALLGSAGAASATTSIEGNLMGKPTPDELEQLQAAIAASGDAAGLLEVYGLVAGQTEGPEEDD
jgi:hypothetical protein